MILVEFCGSVEIGKNVIEVTDGSSKVGMQRNFTCSRGFNFKQDAKYQTITCNADGTWTTESGSSVLTIGDCVKIGRITFIILDLITY